MKAITDYLAAAGQRRQIKPEAFLEVTSGWS